MGGRIPPYCVLMLARLFRGTVRRDEFANTVFSCRGNTWTREFVSLNAARDGKEGRCGREGGSGSGRATTKARTGEAKRGATGMEAAAALRHALRNGYPPPQATLHTA